MMARRTTSRAGTRSLAVATLWLCICVAIACGEQAASTTTPPAGMSGGLPDSACIPPGQNEGCLQSPNGPLRMRCDPDKKIWVIAEACKPEYRCVEVPAASGLGFTTECRPIHEVDAGSDVPVDAGPIPKLNVTVGGVATTSYLFSPGAAGGDTKQQVVVLLESTGGGPLTISKLDWSTHNFSLQMKTLKGKPSMPMELDAGTSFEVVILYSYDAAFPDTKGGTLLIESDDPDLKSLELKFDFAKAGGTLKPPSAELEYVDPQPNKTDTKCVTMSNIGDGDIAYDKVVFDTPDKLWKVSKGPVPGTKLAAQSSKTHEFCFQVIPAGPDVDHNNAASIHYTDAINSPVRVELKVKWENTGDLLVKCEALDGKLIYDFKGEKSKTKRLCTLTNKIGEPLELKSIEVATDEPGWQPIVIKLFEVDPYLIVPGDGKVSFSAPKTLGTKQSAFLPVTFYPDAGPIADAELRIGWVQGSNSDTVKIPILAKP